MIGGGQQPACAEIDWRLSHPVRLLILHEHVFRPGQAGNIFLYRMRGVRRPLCQAHYSPGEYSMVFARQHEQAKEH